MFIYWESHLVSTIQLKENVWSFKFIETYMSILNFEANETIVQVRLRCHQWSSVRSGQINNINNITCNTKNFFLHFRFQSK